MREWCEQILVEVVLAARRSSWSPEQLDALLSPSSLTAALLPRHLLHATLQKRLGQKLGGPTALRVANRLHVATPDALSQSRAGDTRTYEVRAGTGPARPPDSVGPLRDQRPPTSRPLTAPATAAFRPLDPTRRRGVFRLDGCGVRRFVLHEPLAFVAPLSPSEQFSLICPPLGTCRFAGLSLVGETGFEPATARPPAGCATRLRHSPWSGHSKAATRRAAAPGYRANLESRHIPGL